MDMRKFEDQADLSFVRECCACRKSSCSCFSLYPNVIYIKADAAGYAVVLDFAFVGIQFTLCGVMLKVKSHQLPTELTKHCLAAHVTSAGSFLEKQVST